MLAASERSVQTLILLVLVLHVLLVLLYALLLQEMHFYGQYLLTIRKSLTKRLLFGMTVTEDFSEMGQHVHHVLQILILRHPIISQHAYLVRQEIPVVIVPEVMQVFGKSLIPFFEYPSGKKKTDHLNLFSNAGYFLNGTICSACASGTYTADANSVTVCSQCALGIAACSSPTGNAILW